MLYNVSRTFHTMHGLQAPWPAVISTVIAIGFSTNHLLVVLYMCCLGCKPAYVNKSAYS